MEARKGKGVEVLMAVLELHHKHIKNDAQGNSKKREKMKRLVLALFKEDLRSSTLKKIQGKTAFEEEFFKRHKMAQLTYKAVQMVMDLALTKK